MRSQQLVHTYSIVAMDRERGELGAAVQSHYFSVGSLCIWAEPGVGAVATQAMVNPTFGSEGLARMAAGDPPAIALARLLAADTGAQHRQLALISAVGKVSAYTGDRCIAEAGHRTGDGYSVQANMMLRPTVIDAMADAYEQTSGPTGERMLAALQAAQAQGGDIRGKQSAALIVVAANKSGDFFADRRVNLRVEDNPEPITELSRLLLLQSAYDHATRGDIAMERSDVEAALHEYARARGLAPENLELQYWNAVALANVGRIDEAIALFTGVFSQEPQWRELTRRVHTAGLTGFDQSMLDRITAL